VRIVRVPHHVVHRDDVAQANAGGVHPRVQFLEFLGGIAAESAEGNIVRLSVGLFRPIAADDIAPVVAEVALAAPRNGIVEIAGPERMGLMKR
jgi:uncharacterized protein YbjT (DUF2867 family)